MDMRTAVENSGCTAAQHSAHGAVYATGLVPTPAGRLSRAACCDTQALTRGMARAIATTCLRYG